MLCRYVALYALRSLSLPPETEDLLVFTDEQARISARVVRNPDRPMADADRGSVLATLLLRAMFNAEDGPATTERIEIEVTKRADDRRRKASNAPFLFITGECDRDVDLSGPICKSLPDFTLCFDLIDKEIVRAAFRPSFAAIISSVSLAVADDCRVDFVGDAVYLVRTDGHVIYSLTATGNAPSLTVSRQAPDLAEHVGTYVRGLRSGPPDLSSVLSLLNSASDSQAERLRAFVSAWSGLELFVGKAFPVYERLWFDRLLDAADRADHSHLQNIRDVVKSKYTLAWRFSVIAIWLSPSSAAAELATFIRLKRTRDRLFHGGDLDALPTAETVELLRKYLRLHVERAAAPRNGQ